MVKKEAIFIAGAIIVGAAVAGSLFMFYPDMMFGQSSLSAQSGGASSGLPAVSPQETVTADSNSAGGSNSTNATVGTSPYGATQ
jgi:hypothetical protein